jgi:hypothetical protein
LGPSTRVVWRASNGGRGLSIIRAGRGQSPSKTKITPLKVDIRTRPCFVRGCSVTLRLTPPTPPQGLDQHTEWPVTRQNLNSNICGFSSPPWHTEVSMIVDIARLPDIYPPRHREFAYVIVAEPDSFVLYKAYTNNIGTVRLAEFKTRKEADSFVNDLPPARRVWL